ncbi:hypothetical protein BCON_0296g00090 [Botryotinia convoluta]|uniref:Uncharacterized protein n=1 Tax=Botryotinia convoluta TaxID=54673 RepID=A0A4Z1HJW4_9HELO|nr:hypothetical protein BCON_0296g00090 [Botryotinia convoluta]
MADTDTKSQNDELRMARRGILELAEARGEDFASVCREEVLKIRRKLANIQRFRKDAARTNERGIPYAPFVDRVEDYVTTRADVEPTLKRFQEMIS